MTKYGQRLCLQFCTLPVPGYLYEWAAGLVHDCPRVGGQRPAEEGGAQVHRHRGEPAHTEREGDDMPWYNRMQCSSVYLTCHVSNINNMYAGIDTY